MFNYQLRIVAQYSENYAAGDLDWDGKAEAWKNKGVSEFVATVDSNFRFNDSDVVKSAIQDVLAAKSNGVARYELIEFEYCDDKPEDITTELLGAVKSINYLDSSEDKAMAEYEAGGFGFED